MAATGGWGNVKDDDCLHSDDVSLRVLRLLWERKGTAVSGGSMSEQLGISRTAVWKHVQSLRERGIAIRSLDRKGYVLDPEARTFLPEWVVLERERQNRGERRFGHVVCYRPAMDSTNERARQLAERGAPEGCVVFCDEQRAGRARRGRTWYSPPGRSLYMTVLLRPQLPMHHVPQLTLVTAVAVTQCLRDCFRIDAAEIKWPNDVLIHGKKVCGILVEAVGHLEALDYAVVGIGLNVNGTTEYFPEEVRGRATTLEAAAGRSFDRLDVLLGVLDALERCYAHFVRNGFGGIRRQWIQMNGTLGRPIIIHRANGEASMRYAEDLAPDGALLVRDEAGNTERVIAGEIELADPR